MIAGHEKTGRKVESANLSFDTILRSILYLIGILTMESFLINFAIRNNISWRFGGRIERRSHSSNCSWSALIGRLQILMAHLGRRPDLVS